MKCATLIRQIRNEFENIILVDCGDMFQGSAESFLSRGELVARAINHLEYDCIVAGNHEFDWGIERLKHLYNIIQAPVLAANMTLPPNSREYALPSLTPFIIKNIRGVKIAFIGLTNPNNHNWFLPEYTGAYQFHDSVETLTRIMPKVRAQGANIIILLAHQGYRSYGDNAANQINSIARRFPDIDMIIGGHTHQPVETEIVNGILYTQAGPYGIWLGKATLVYDRKTQKLVERKARLIVVDGAVETDPELESALGEEPAKAEKHLSAKVGFTSRNITPEHVTPGQSGVQTLIAAAIAEATGADAVIHGTLSQGRIPKGKIFARHVWGVVPYDNRTGIAMLNKQDLKKILEENAGYIRSLRFKGVYGLTYILARNESGQHTVSDIRLTDGRILAPEQRIKVAFNSYDLASGGGRLPVLREICLSDSSNFVLLKDETRDAVFKYLKKHSPLDIQPAKGAVVNE